MDDRLKALREARGWSQNRLAKESGVSQPYISELEAGKSAPTLPIIKKLATALGVSVAELLGEDESKPTGTETKLLCRECFLYSVEDKPGIGVAYED